VRFRQFADRAKLCQGNRKRRELYYAQQPAAILRRRRFVREADDDDHVSGRRRAKEAGSAMLTGEGDGDMLDGRKRRKAPSEDAHR
jgi:hypothetical protein